MTHFRVFGPVVYRLAIAAFLTIYLQVYMTYGIIVHPTYNRAFNVKAPETFVELLHNTSSLVWVSGIWMDLYQAPADGRRSNHMCRLHHCNKESIHTYIHRYSK